MKFLCTVLASVYIVLLAIILLQGCENTTPEPEPVVSNEEDIIEAAYDVGGEGELKVTLMWNFAADMDLHVVQPNGTEIYFEHSRDERTGCFLDVDNIEGGPGSAENIFWENPMEGEYSVVIHVFSDSNNCVHEGPCRVVVFNGNNEPQTFTIQMTHQGQREHVTTFNYRR